MNLDDFKSLAKGVTAPAGAPVSAINLKSFIAEMRARDQRERRNLAAMAVIYLSMGLVFAGAAMGAQPGNRLIGLGILLVALYAGAKGLQFGRVDYSAPSREFLAAAARRYQFWRPVDALCAVPLWLILCVGGGLTVWATARKYLSESLMPLALAGYGVFLAIVTVFGFIQGRKLWRQKSASVLEDILRRQQELSNS